MLNELCLGLSDIGGVALQAVDEDGEVDLLHSERVSRGVGEGERRPVRRNIAQFASFRGILL